MTNGKCVADGPHFGFDCLQNWLAVNEQEYDVLSHMRAVCTKHCQNGTMSFLTQALALMMGGPS